MLNPYFFINELTSLLPSDAVIVCANGTACIATFRSGIVKEDTRMIWNSGCAAMGYGLPSAIGASIAVGKSRDVICIEGDGSLQLNIQELATIMHHELPVKIFVLSNGGYHSLQETQDNYFNSNYIGSTFSDLSFPDLHSLAIAYGLPYFSITDTMALKSILKISGPLICEVQLGEYKFIKHTF